MQVLSSNSSSRAMPRELGGVCQGSGCSEGQLRDFYFFSAEEMKQPSTFLRRMSLPLEYELAEAAA
jgi:hypothetical protein